MRVNELADRYGVKPYEFTTSCHYESGKCHLSYDTVPENTRQGERYGKMLDAVCGRDGDELAGSYQEVIDTLDHAIRKAPRPRLK